MELIRNIFIKTNNVKRSSYVWNMISTLVFACQSAGLLIIIARACGQSDAGVFSISYSVASMMAFIGEYGVRKYQASDVSEECSFSDYAAHRVITCLLMMAASLAYGLYGRIAIGYTADKFTVMMLICYIKVVESVHDLFYSRFQQLHRLDISAKTACFRTVIGIIIYAAALILTKDLLISTVIWAAAVTLSALLALVVTAPEYCDFSVRPRPERIRKIFLDCFPLFVGLFLLMYIGNAPKYAIDATLTDELQAKYTYIFMPVFVIGLFANFVFNPLIVELADAWDGRKYDAFLKIVFRQVLVIGSLTVLAILVALTIGCPVLGILYDTNLADLKIELAILMVGGGMLAMANFISVIATIVREQKCLVPGYFLVSLLALLFARRMVAAYGLMGASCLYTILLTALTAYFAAVQWSRISRTVRNNKPVE